jgi:hypothetical protein
MRRSSSARRIAVVSSHVDPRLLPEARRGHLTASPTVAKGPAKSKVKIEEQGLEASDVEHALPEMNQNAHFGEAEKASSLHPSPVAP